MYVLFLKVQARSKVLTAMFASYATIGECWALSKCQSILAAAAHTCVGVHRVKELHQQSIFGARIQISVQPVRMPRAASPNYRSSAAPKIAATELRCTQRYAHVATFEELNQKNSGLDPRCNTATSKT